LSPQGQMKEPPKARERLRGLQRPDRCNRVANVRGGRLQLLRAKCGRRIGRERPEPGESRFELRHRVDQHHEVERAGLEWQAAHPWPQQPPQQRPADDGVGNQPREPLLVHESTEIISSLPSSIPSSSAALPRATATATFR